MTSFYHHNKLTQELWDLAQTPLRLMYLNIAKIYALDLEGQF